MKKQQDQLAAMRHTTEHVLTAAMINVYGNQVVMAMGPATDDGFYFDFAFDGTFSEKEFPKIEKEMQKIIAADLPMTRAEISVPEARKIFSDNKYKLEWLDGIEAKGEKVTIYSMGDVFTDLCAGPHAASTGAVKAFKLLKTAGAYWRGDEKNEMLTRVYGTAFFSNKDLDAYLNQLAEAAKRDHRKISREMNLYTFSDLVGAGLPMFTPAGTVIRTELQNALLDISQRYGMQPVTIPHIAKRKLYEVSGHAKKFAGELMVVKSHYDEFVMKPVNCPHHTQIYASVPRSYRDLPLRLMESTMQYRDEKPGEISGLTRVRAISVDDGHIFCTIDQVAEEAKRIAHIIEEFYKGLGLWGNHWVSLSVRDPKTPDAYVGSKDGWQKAETMLASIAKELKLEAKRVEGEAAIYGPKLDYMFKDSLGREWQLATIQIDFAMPERFELTYTGQDGKLQTPVMIHRAILGSYERFMAILIEHFAGKFPTWLAPTQVIIMTVSQDHKTYAAKVTKTLQQAGVRVHLNDANDSLGKKVKQARFMRPAYQLVIGDKEMQSKALTVENVRTDKKTSMSLADFISNISKEIADKR